MTSEEARVLATLLGTGTSTGIPVIGCDCRVCRSDDPRDRRLRTSCFIRAAGVSILVDAGPDFRYQAMRAGVDAVDAVFVTHHHFDHVAGLDDLRPYLFRERRPIPVYTLPETARVLRRTHGYIFADGSYPGVPDLELREVEGPFVVESRSDPSLRVEASCIPAWHADVRVGMLRIGRFAYATDVNRIPADSLLALAGLDVLVLDALRRRPHRAHFTLDEAAEVAASLGVPRTVLVHMTHSVLHAEEEGLMPTGVELGVDGMELQARLGSTPIGVRPAAGARGAGDGGDAGTSTRPT